MRIANNTAAIHKGIGRDLIPAPGCSRRAGHEKGCQHSTLLLKNLLTFRLLFTWTILETICNLLLLI